MASLSKQDAGRVEAIRAELDVVRLGGPSAIDTILAPVRELLETECVVIHCPTDRGDGWELERWHITGGAQPLKFERIFRAHLASSPGRLLAYDPARPEPAQRNRVVDAGWLDRHQPGALEASALYRNVHVPLGMHRHEQTRALICEGPALLAWCGAFQLAAIEAWQRRLLRALVEPLKRRLSIERRLQADVRITAALGIALDRLGAPAFVLGRKAEIHEVNAAGRRLLEEAGADVRCALRDAVARRASSMSFELIPLAEHGCAPGWLAIRRSDDRTGACAAAASARWRLTPRQAEILELVARGQTNATIAAILGIGERAIEYQVTAIFDRAGVENRAALVASVLME